MHARPPTPARHPCLPQVADEQQLQQEQEGGLPQATGHEGKDSGVDATCTEPMEEDAGGNAAGGAAGAGEPAAPRDEIDGGALAAAAAAAAAAVGGAAEEAAATPAGAAAASGPGAATSDPAALDTLAILAASGIAIPPGMTAAEAEATMAMSAQLAALMTDPNAAASLGDPNNPAGMQMLNTLAQMQQMPGESRTVTPRAPMLSNSPEGLSSLSTFLFSPFPPLPHSSNTHNTHTHTHSLSHTLECSWRLVLCCPCCRCCRNVGRRLRRPVNVRAARPLSPHHRGGAWGKPPGHHGGHAEHAAAGAIGGGRGKGWASGCCGPWWSSSGKTCSSRCDRRRERKGKGKPSAISRGDMRSPASFRTCTLPHPLAHPSHALFLHLSATLCNTSSRTGV
jgi:hypothetical protein